MLPESGALLDAHVFDSQAPADTEVTGALVPAVVSADHADWEAGDWDVEIFEGECEEADLHVARDHDADRGAGAPGPRFGGQSDRVGAIQKKRRVKRGEPGRGDRTDAGGEEDPGDVRVVVAAHGVVELPEAVADGAGDVGGL